MTSEIIRTSPELIDYGNLNDTINELSSARDLLKPSSVVVQLQVKKICEDFSLSLLKENSLLTQKNSEINLSRTNSSENLKCAKNIQNSQPSVSPKSDRHDSGRLIAYSHFNGFIRKCPINKKRKSHASVTRPVISSRYPFLSICDNFFKNSLDIDSSLNPYYFPNLSGKIIMKKRFWATEQQLNNQTLQRRKFSFASNSSKKLTKVPYEQIKKAKIFTETAVREKRVFALHGSFLAIREELLKRGWVEKAIKNYPYMNPHPQNCVCHRIGCGNNSLQNSINLNRKRNSLKTQIFESNNNDKPGTDIVSQIQTEEIHENVEAINNDQVDSINCKLDNVAYECDSNKGNNVSENYRGNENCCTNDCFYSNGCFKLLKSSNVNENISNEPINEILHNATDDNSIFQCDNNNKVTASDRNTASSDKIAANCSRNLVRSALNNDKNCTALLNEINNNDHHAKNSEEKTNIDALNNTLNHCEVERDFENIKPFDINYEGNLRNSSNIANSIEKLIVDNAKELDIILDHREKEDTDKNNYVKMLEKTLNPSFLAPSEIRYGLENVINENNIRIFQYSFPTYDEIKARLDREKKKDSVTVSAGSESENSTDSSRTDANIKELKTNESDPSFNEESYDKSDEKQHKRPKSKKPKFLNYNPYPELEYTLTNLDKAVVARVLRNVEPNFIWTWNKESVSFKHLSRDQTVNRFPNTPFATKYGLCETLQELHWFSETPDVETFVPRAYCIGHEDERSAFIQDYRITACLSILKWVVEKCAEKGVQAIAHPFGEVPIRRVRQSLQQVESFLKSRCHGDIDTVTSPTYIREHDWDLIYSAHYKIVIQTKKIKALPHHASSLVKDCERTLEKVTEILPQLHIDGYRNIWIVKPGAQSRGKGILLFQHLHQILALVQSPLIYQTKYVVQKYIERPLLIYNTKFDIRQWFIVTDWNPLMLWMYKESYLRFCSQQYDLNNSNEAIHLSNNAVQCKYVNGIRDERLPEENMWDTEQFQKYLESEGRFYAYEEIIYPGMREALIATMLAAQVQINSFKNGFEFFGADFMLTEDLRPWLIEINSSPCMAPTTSVTKRMCHESLSDTIKVVIDFKNNRHADTGQFELVYSHKEKCTSAYVCHGVNLEVIGQPLHKPGKKAPERQAKYKKPPIAPTAKKAIPIISLPLKSDEKLLEKEVDEADI